MGGHDQDRIRKEEAETQKAADEEQAMQLWHLRLKASGMFCFGEFTVVCVHSALLNYGQARKQMEDRVNQAAEVHPRLV